MNGHRVGGGRRLRAALAPLVALGALLASGCGATNATPAASTSTAAASAAANAQPIRAVGTPSADGVHRRYSNAPALTIDLKRPYTAVFHMEKGGEFTVQLLPESAPGYVNNFVFLSKLGFYNGLTFHRVIPGFVAQGGDPMNEVNGPGYMLTQERNSVKLEAGVIAMASSPAGVNGSQFFITLEPQPSLEANFAAFGRVTSGMEVVRAISPRDPARGGNLPPGDVIKRIEIIGRP